MARHTLWAFLLVCAVTSLTSCDGSPSVPAAEADAAFDPLSPYPSIERVERAFVIPAHIPGAVFDRGEAIAEANACGARASVLPAGSRVRVVEEDGLRRVFVRLPRRVSDRADVASAGGNAQKGDGRVNAGDATERNRGASLGAYTGETEYRCSCSDGPQNQTTGCTPAANPDTGHIYCDAYGDCEACTMTVTVIGEG